VILLCRLWYCNYCKTPCFHPLPVDLGPSSVHGHLNVDLNAPSSAEPGVSSPFSSVGLVDGTWCFENKFKSRSFAEPLAPTRDSCDELRRIVFGEDADRRLFRRARHDFNPMSGEDVLVTDREN
jgi:hypothetical protein